MSTLISWGGYFHFKTIYPAKHVLSKVEGTPRRKEIVFFMSELGVLCVFARVIFFRFSNSPPVRLDELSHSNNCRAAQ